VYYRIWIKDYATIARSIYALFRKGVEWVWTDEQSRAMERLQLALTTAPALVKIHYGPESREIVVGVDASLDGWGATLGQIQENGRLGVNRFESGMWNQAERNYDATKRECRGVLKALKKFKYQLYGVHFILETDANVLVAQLNKGATDLPGALVTRWLAWIRLFDFDVRHVPGSKHTAADGLSRRPRTASDDIDEAHEVDIDDWIEGELFSDTFAQLNAMSISPVSVAREDGIDVDDGLPLQEGYSDDSQRIAKFLVTLTRPKEMSTKEFRHFKAQALRYQVDQRQLWRRSTKTYPRRLVLDSTEARSEVLHALHDELGHKGRESTYHRVAARYYWDNLYKECAEHVAACRPCQKRDGQKQYETLHATEPEGLFVKIGLDVVYMSPSHGNHYLVVARDDFSGWPEARALASNKASSIAKFIWEDIICRHGLVGRIVVDGGPENKKEVISLLARWGIGRIQISAYNPPANGMVERGHKSLCNALAKMSNGGKKKWSLLLPAGLLAERTTVHAPTGYTPYYMVYGRHPILPVETKFPTWRTLAWDKVRTREELLALRIRQIEMRDEDAEEGRLAKKRHREAGKELFDATHNIRTIPLKKGDIVLRHDVLQEIDMSSDRKLNYRWLGPYRVRKAKQNKGTYWLEELDGTHLEGTFAAWRLKRFIQTQKYFWSPHDDMDPPSDEEDNDDALELDPFSLEQQESEDTFVVHKNKNLTVRIIEGMTQAQKDQYRTYPDDIDEEIASLRELRRLRRTAKKQTAPRGHVAPSAGISEKEAGNTGLENPL
jgi:hypothetical protein